MPKLLYALVFVVNSLPFVQTKKVVTSSLLDGANDETVHTNLCCEVNWSLEGKDHGTRYSNWITQLLRRKKDIQKDVLTTYATTDMKDQ